MGYRSLWRRLRNSYKLTLKQSSVLKLLQIIDPEGIKVRFRRGLGRRKNYSVPGPNHIWNMDGYDKLKPYGFALQGCVDGFSRKVLWAKVGTTNNKPEVVAHHYAGLVMETGYIPVVDAGTENTLTGLIQQALRHRHANKYAGKDSYVVGPSTANQRIERYWREARRNTTGFHIDFFKTMIDNNVLNNKDILDREILRFCFAHLIQRDLNRAVDEWNSHRVRAQASRGLPSVIPNVMFHSPELYKAKICQKKVNVQDVKRIRERFAMQPELYNKEVQDPVTLLVPNATTPDNIEEAYKLYILVKTRMTE